MAWMATMMAGVALAGASPAQAPDPAAAQARFEGDWDGTLDAGGAKLRLALHIHVKDGVAAATIDSPDQGARDLPANLRLHGDHILLAPKTGGGEFDGSLSPDGATLSGHWGPGRVTFTRRAAGVDAPAAALNRPQTPVKPYPYDEAMVAFDNNAAHVRLAGTLTTPRGPGPFPAVVLISGSGAQLRDETILGHQVFVVLADYLTRHGIAVLRYDKRGLGESTGDYVRATSADFAADAEAAVAFLRTQPRIDARRIGLIGHSEGGVVAPIVANADPSLAFIVMMAGPGVRGAEIIEAQSRLIAKAAGAPPEVLDKNQALQHRFVEAVLTARDGPSAEAAARAILKDAGVPDAAAAAQAKAASSDWYRFFLGHDPAPDLRRLRLPVLALVGSKDLQVPAEQNLPALRAALADDPQAEVREMPGLNHLFQTAGTGSPSEYGQIEETISPSALQPIAEWILKQPKR